MSAIAALLLVTFLAIVIITVFLNSTPFALANFLRKSGPFLLMITGIALLAFGRAGIGMPIMMMGGMWLYRNRGVGKISQSGKAQVSTVRSAWLEMQLDHDTGDLEGQILTGPLEGVMLSELDNAALMELYENLATDPESAALMEAYLDRRMPLWRDHTQSSSDTREGHTFGSGTMSKQEAYQVLGLSDGASASEIKAAHRRLMKAVHPDSGGSTFLAARINEAKDMLLD